MYLLEDPQSHFSRLSERQDDRSSGIDAKTIILIAFTVSLGVFFAVVGIRHFWKWGPNFKSSTNGDARRRLSDGSGDGDEAAARSAVESGVNRNASVRSVMTLPAYSMRPKDTEQTIGREGERGGVDTVVEFPETADEEETRRDQEMESLHQIRVARRRENEEAERLRQARREARDQGDLARYEALRLQSRLRAESLNDPDSGDVTAATMLAEHRSRGRERRVSSVSYADIGQVQHDGSRVRNSQDSERGGLLDGAAAIDQNSGRSRAGSASSSFLSAVRTRGRSRSSLSLSAAAGDDIENNRSSQRSSALLPRASDGLSGPSGLHHTMTTTNWSPDASRSHSEAGVETSTPSQADVDHLAHTASPPRSSPNDPDLPQPPSYDAGSDEPNPFPTPALAGGAVPDDATASAGFNPEPSPPISTAPGPPQLHNLPSIHVEVASESPTPSSPVRRNGDAAGS